MSFARLVVCASLAAFSAAASGCARSSAPPGGDAGRRDGAPGGTGDGARGGTGGGGTGGAGGAGGGAVGDGGPGGGDGGPARDGAPADLGPGGDGAAGDRPPLPPGDGGCAPACDPDGRRCGPGGGLQTCAPDRNGCLVWGPEVPCGANSTCTGAAPGATCACKPPPAGCAMAGPFCDVSGGAGMCAIDEQGCLHAASVTACPPGQACKGTAPAVACACDMSCTAAQVGSYCRDARTLATCTTGDGCFASVNPTPCLGVRSCQGAPGGAACLCPAAGTTPGTSCATAGASMCSGAMALTCAADPAGSGCLVWTVLADCAALPGGGLPCNTTSGTAACACPGPTGAEIYVDPVAGSDGSAGVVPTGALTPPACRFRTLGRGLQAARASGMRVIAATASPPAAFAAESFPLTVPSGVTLTTGDVTFNPASYTIRFTSTTAPAAVVLGAGAALEGYTVQTATGNAAAAAVSCKDGAVSMRSLELVGAPAATMGKPAVGIVVGDAAGDSCAATVTGVRVSGFAVGISVFSAAMPAAATLSDVTLQDNGQGPGGGGLVVGGGAVAATKLSIGRRAGATGTWGVVLEARSAGLVPSLASNGMRVTDTSHAGLELRQAAGRAAPQATVSATQIRAGAGTEPGIRVLAGSLSIGDGSSVHNSESDGLRLMGGTVSVSSGSRFDTNGRDGVRVSGGTLTGIGFGASANSGDGVEVMGGTVTLHRVTLASNVGRGLHVAAGNVTLDDGSIVKSNGTGLAKAAGVHVAGGAVSIGAPTGARVEVADNGLDGVKVLAPGATTSVAVTGALVSGSGGHGLAVDLDGAGGVVAVTDARFERNLEGGVVVHRAPAAATGADAVVIEASQVRDNGVDGPAGVGIWLRGNLGDLAAAIRGCVITGNRDFGVLVEQGASATTRARIDSNDISNNNRSAGRPAGGIYFATPSTLDSFTANRLHANVGDEIGIAARPNGGDTWVLRGPALACDTSANHIFCYGPPPTPGVGIRIQPTAPAGTRVDAQNVVWAGPLPTRGLDYEHPDGTAVIVTPACLPSTATCP